MGIVSQNRHRWIIVLSLTTLPLGCSQFEKIKIETRKTSDLSMSQTNVSTDEGLPVIGEKAGDSSCTENCLQPFPPDPIPSGPTEAFSCGVGKIWICHVPTGNVEARHTLCVDLSGTLQGHGIRMEGKLGDHGGDFPGPCEKPDPTPSPSPIPAPPGI